MINAYQSSVAGDQLNASNELAAVFAYYPWRVDLNIEAARYAYQAGDPKAAIQYLETPGTIAYLTSEDLILFGDMYNQSGDFSKAEAIWKDVTKLGDSNQVFRRLVDLYLQQNDFDSAVIYLQKMLTLTPSDSHLYYKIGLLYAGIDPLKALPFLAQAAEIDPSNTVESRDLHDKIRTANLFDQPAYTLLASGRQLASMGEWVLAAEAFRRASALDPEYAEAWAFLGEAQQQIAKKDIGSIPDVGLTELEMALELDANSILGNTFMGLYWERQGDYSQAQHYVEQAITLNSSDPYLYSELGNILSKAGDLPAAQAAYEAAIHLSPQDPLFYRLLAEFAMENQIQIRELALPAIRQAIILSPQDSSSLDVMAQIMLMLQDYHSAERYSLDALDSNPAFPLAYLHLGTAYLYLGESNLALKWLTVAKQVEPDSWIAAQATRMIDYYLP